MPFLNAPLAAMPCSAAHLRTFLVVFICWRSAGLDIHPVSGVRQARKVKGIDIEAA